ncbi:uncharacterized protein Tco025E_06279, partial [Trypanosoma conorhini]
MNPRAVILLDAAHPAQATPRGAGVRGTRRQAGQTLLAHPPRWFDVPLFLPAVRARAPLGDALRELTARPLTLGGGGLRRTRAPSALALRPATGDLLRRAPASARRAGGGEASRPPAAASAPQVVGTSSRGVARKLPGRTGGLVGGLALIASVGGWGTAGVMWFVTLVARGRLGSVFFFSHFCFVLLFPVFLVLPNEIVDASVGCCLWCWWADLIVFGGGTRMLLDVMVFFVRDVPWEKFFEVFLFSLFYSFSCFFLLFFFFYCIEMCT